MAVKKATTTNDLTSPEDVTAQAVDLSPTRADLVESVTEVTDPNMVEDVKAVKTVKVKSPAGFVTEVPEGIAGTLLDSGYSKSK